MRWRLLEPDYKIPITIHILHNKSMLHFIEETMLTKEQAAKSKYFRPFQINS